MSRETCNKVIPGELSDRYAAYGGIICLRKKGHTGRCVPMRSEAAAADGVCQMCHQKLPKKRKLPTTKAKGKRGTR